MQEKGDKGLLVKQLKDMLDWYTFQATDEEYEEENVEHILNLLDSFDPIEEEDLPQRDAAWERFRRMAGEELLDRAAQASDSSASDNAVAIGEESLARAAQTPDSVVSHRFVARMGRFTTMHRYVAAVILAMVILAVSGSAHAIATQGSDFFFWLKRSETGTKMMVSPEWLDGVTEQKNVHYYQNDKELPEWAQEWSQIAECVEMPEEYEFQYFEVSEYENFQGVVGHYMDPVVSMEILLGTWTYDGKISYNKEEFVGYNYVQSYEIDGMQMDIFNRTEENEYIFYAICFYKENSRYMVKGQDNLEELKQLAERYLHCMQGNL